MFVFLTMTTLYPDGRLTGFTKATKTLELVYWRRLNSKRSLPVLAESQKNSDFFLQIYSTVQQVLRVKCCVFGVFVCFGLYFVNYRSWQAEILQEHAEGCRPPKKTRQD